MLWCQAGKSPQLPPPVVGFDVSDLNTLLDAIKREAGVHILPLPDARLTSIIGVLFAVLVALGAYLGQSARLWQAEGGREGCQRERHRRWREGTPCPNRGGMVPRRHEREGGRPLTHWQGLCVYVCLSVLYQRSSIPSGSCRCPATGSSGWWCRCACTGSAWAAWCTASSAPRRPTSTTARDRSSSSPCTRESASQPVRQTHRQAGRQADSVLAGGGGDGLW